MFTRRVEWAVLILRSPQLEVAIAGGGRSWRSPQLEVDREFSISGRLDLVPPGPLPSWAPVLEYFSLWSVLILFGRHPIITVFSLTTIHGSLEWRQPSA